MLASSPGITAGFVGAVGNTPLIRLNALSDATGCEILGKAEFMNPGGSVKDRAALGILMEAEEQGLLQSGGTVVEGTAGTVRTSAPRLRSRPIFSADWVSGITIKAR